MNLPNCLKHTLFIWLTAILTSSGAEPTRILCIGDSITQGGRSGLAEYTYRVPLYRMLRDAGFAIDFVGSRQHGASRNFKWPEDFDRDHEGYGGWGHRKVAQQLKKTLPTFPVPDFALIHLGTNDQKASSYTRAIGEPLAEIIRLLRDRNPQVVVLVGHLNFNGGPALKIRPIVEKVCKELHTSESPILTVPHFEGWIARPTLPGHDCFDWVHPNPQGQRKMAEKWFEYLEPFLIPIEPELQTTAA